MTKMKFLKPSISIIIFLILIYFISSIHDFFLQILLLISSFLFIVIVNIFTGDVAEALEVE